MPTTNDPYAAIKALRDKTIPGPWGVIKANYEEDSVTFLIVDSDDSRVAALEIAHEGDAEAVQGAEADAYFIWHAEHAQDWLNANGPEILQNNGKPDLVLRASTRLTNALVAYKPRQELVLSWAAAQLARSNLHALVTDALGLAVTGDLNQLRRTYCHLWFGDIRPTKRPVGAD
ncbi:hypothetical protein [Streptomyces sp. NBC_00829]|uniref:hypothetical protein n=1 Tax=Streptomyces sp. NBC_00829 TaxID=2903679 RepID=UPI00387092B6|nr:hypothetical protein OG293_15500 [Streptomyces sp. NBC_00829]